MLEEVDEAPTLEEAEVPPQGRRKTRRIIAVGQDGEVELLRNSVVIRRKGFLSFMFHGSMGDKEILLSFVTGIEFRDVWVNALGMNQPGYIRFQHAGSTHRSPLGSPLHDDNTVAFRRDSRKAFLALKEAVEERIHEIHTK
jgi:hypothetical protein